MRPLRIATVLFVLLTVSAVHAETLRIGSIADEYVGEVAKFRPLTRHLHTTLAPLGYDKIKIAVTNSMEQMAEQMVAGEIDLFIDSPYPALVVSEQANSQMVLRRWKKGVEQYHSVIFVRKYSPYQNLNHLKGQRIAFEEPFSTASYFLGKSALIQQGLNPQPAQKGAAGAEDVRYYFSGEDSTTITWVLRRRTEAGTINLHKFNQLKPKIRDQLRIIHTSPAVPRHIVSFRADLPQQTIQQVSQALIEMEQSEAGQKALQQFERTRKFDPIPAADLENLMLLKQQINTTR